MAWPLAHGAAKTTILLECILIAEQYQGELDASSSNPQMKVVYRMRC